MTLETEDKKTRYDGNILVFWNSISKRRKNMEELNDLLKIAKHETGASPIIAKFLLSIASLDTGVDINILLTKVSLSNIEKMFTLLKKMKKSNDFYFQIIDKIQEERGVLKSVSMMEWL